MVNLFKRPDKRFRILIPNHGADVSRGVFRVEQQSDCMIHLYLADKGRKTDTSLFSNQFGAVRNGVVKMLCQFFQRDRAVVVVDKTQHRKCIGAAAGFLSGTGQDGLICIASQELGKEDGHQIVEQTPTVSVAEARFLIDIQNDILDIQILSGRKEDASGRVLTVKTAHKEIRKDIVITQGTEEGVIKGVMADMNAQQHTIIKNLNGALHSRRNE